MLYDPERIYAERIEGKTGREYMVHIYIDPDPLNPRTNGDIFGNILSWNTRYDLEDIVGSDMRRFISDEGINRGSEADVLEALEEEFGVIAIRPLYLFDHSGISVSTFPFGCQWDSGQVGYIVATATKFKEYIFVDYDRENPDHMKMANDMLDREVNEFDQYLTGNQYIFSLIGIKHCECCGAEEFIYLESVSGYTEIDDAMEDAHGSVEYYETEGLKWEIE